MKRKLLLLISSVLFLLLPFWGSYIKWGGVPPGFGLFPAQQVHPEPEFNPTYFMIACGFAALILIFFIFPRLFGFKKAATKKRETANVGFPSWFWPSFVVLALSWIIMWVPLDIFDPLTKYTFVPLWWGFILAMDGWVYKRNNGKSLMSVKPNTITLLAVVSCIGWFVFEYLNYFVMENWYYPNNEIFTNFGNITWFLLSFTTVLPIVFEIYLLLKSFPKLTAYYSKGPKIKFSRPMLILILALGLASSFLMGLFPFYLFWLLWVSIIPALAIPMIFAKWWTPFDSISKEGNWSQIMLIAIATLITGFFWEFWNYGSEVFHGFAPTNPNYWIYSIPFLDKYRPFSQMPILGYFGYLFFGVVCWVVWLAAAYIFGFNPSINVDDENNPE
jgi:hypothetical protein